ncbi:unnamed protein product, partial [marine sediment metagenome]
KAAAMALGDTEGYARSYALMLDSAGLTQEAFAKQSATLSFQLDRAKQSINVVAVTIGDVLMPAVGKIIAYVLTLTKRFREWAKVNKDNLETIVKWAAGLGVALAFLGPILIILPGLIVALGLLKIAFIPFLVGGVIITGIIALNKAYKELKKTLYLTPEEAKRMTLAELNESIEILMKSVDELETAIERAEFGDAKGKIATITINRWKKELEEAEIALDMACVARQELTDAQKEGVDVTEELSEIDKAMAEQR